MSKTQTPNPYFNGTQQHAAWQAGYMAALRDAAGIAPPKPILGRDIIR